MGPCRITAPQGVEHTPRGIRSAANYAGKLGIFGGDKEPAKPKQTPISTTIRAYLCPISHTIVVAIINVMAVHFGSISRRHLVVGRHLSCSVICNKNKNTNLWRLHDESWPVIGREEFTRGHLGSRLTWIQGFDLWLFTYSQWYIYFITLEM